MFSAMPCFILLSNMTFDLSRKHHCLQFLVSCHGNLTVKFPFKRIICLVLIYICRMLLDKLVIKILYNYQQMETNPSRNQSTFNFSKSKEYLVKFNVKVPLQKGSATLDDQCQFVWILIAIFEDPSSKSSPGAGNLCLPPLCFSSPSSPSNHFNSG